MCLSIHKLRERVSSEHSELKQKELEHMPKASHGYGGKFGLQQDRMDKARRFALITHSYCDVFVQSACFIMCIFPRYSMSICYVLNS